MSDHSVTVAPSGAPTSPQPELKLGALPKALLRSAAYFTPPRFIHRRRMHRSAGIPRPGASALAAVSVLADEVVLAGFKITRNPPTDEAWERIAGEVDEALELFEQRGWLDDPRSFHATPNPPSDIDARDVRRWERLGLRWEQLRWTSTWQPDPDDPGAERWMSYDRNHRGSAWLLRHEGDQPRPWVVVLHGTEQGRLLVDQRVFRAKHLHEDLGCNVVMPLLPLHASRRPRIAATTGFPTLDVLDNVHGLAQSAYDVRCLLGWVRDQQPSGVALVGLSLGGGVAALVAGLEEPLGGVAGLVPAVDFPDVFHRQTPHMMRNEAAFVRLDASSRTLHQVVSPMSFEPATPPERLHILAGLSDRLLDPCAQAGRLAAHWGTDNVRWVHQGHVTHMGSGALVETIDDAVAGCGADQRA